MRRINNRLLSIITAFGVGLFAAQLTQAQTNTGPSGSFTNVVSGATNLVWDLAGVFTNVEFSITNLGSGSSDDEVAVSYAATYLQMGNGRILGAGDTTVYLTAPGTNTVFPGTYKLNGSISSNTKAQGRVLLHSVAKGETLLEDRHSVVKLRKVTANQTINVKLDNTVPNVAGTERDSASAAGVGGTSGQQTIGPESSPAVFGGDGSWTLTMDISTTGTLVLGTGVVTLNSGQTFNYVVKGHFKSKDDTSKLVLTGADLATKGSVLQVKMSGNTVTAIKGKISGQSVNVVY